MIYISGKISDTDREQELINLSLFGVVEDQLRRQGYEVFNPASLEVDGGTWEYYLSRDLLWIVENRPDLYLLANWQDSKGARLEVAFAELLGLKILNK